MSALRIALLGAESIGKTTLARDLAAHFDAVGQQAVFVPEVLREWCESHGREPRPEEHLAIAREQERRVDDGATSARIVVADTTAMMVAIYGALLFEGHELYRLAIERQRAYDVTLVTGLDLPWTADGLHRQGPQAQAAVDAQVRALLAKWGVAFRVVYGTGAERLRNALAAANASLAPEPARSWTWQCEKCSDPDCEHRLFTSLVRGGR